jgi:hypothetical protein
MSYHGGPPSWVSKQNEAILSADADRINSELEKTKKENSDLQKELEIVREKLRECMKKLDERNHL